MSRYLELKAQLEALTKELETVRLEERHEAIATCRQLMETFELTAQDLGLVKVQQLPPKRAAPHTFAVKLPRRTYPPKYRDPASGKTWCGRGHVPAWIDGNRDEYLIRDASSDAPDRQQERHPKAA